MSALFLLSLLIHVTHKLKAILCITQTYINNITVTLPEAYFEQQVSSQPVFKNYRTLLTLVYFDPINQGSGSVALMIQLFMDTRQLQDLCIPDHTHLPAHLLWLLVNTLRLTHVAG